MRFKFKDHYKLCHIFADGELKAGEVWAEDLDEAKRMARNAMIREGSDEVIISRTITVGEVRRGDEDVD